MQNNKRKWTFINSSKRPKLDVSEVMYWKRTFENTLKIGMEFELNLPEDIKRTCKGNNVTCKCEHYINDCWKKCINTSECKAFRKVESCLNATLTCYDEDCQNCEFFSAKTSECHGINCSSFTSYCLVCKDYSTPCKECEYRFDPTKSPEYIRNDIADTLKPNNSYGRISKSGICNITVDGSLLGDHGVEIITCGRRVSYNEFFKMAQQVIKESRSRGAYLNERCSLHMHALASYYGKSGRYRDASIPCEINELERSLPEIILVNLHQLVRRYQNAMTWMMMGLSSEEHMTRWEKFRRSVLHVDAKNNKMYEVICNIANNTSRPKYSWINYNNIGFDKSGDVDVFHVEFRAADGLYSPSAVAAIACMYYALVIKAVDISRYGVLDIDDSWLKQALKVKDAILNNNGDWNSDRLSNTSNIRGYEDVLVQESLDLVHQLKPILLRTGYAYEVLEKLAKQPCAVRRVAGDSWNKIEDDLQIKIPEEHVLGDALSEIITLNQISNCANLEEWISIVGDTLREDFTELGELNDSIAMYCKMNYDNGRMVWSNSIGAPILI